MRTLLLVTGDEAVRSRVLRGLPDYSPFSADSDEEALKILRLTRVDLIVKDATAHVRDLPILAARMRQLCPSAVIIYLHSPDGLTAEAEECLATADFLLRNPFESHDLAAVLRQAEDKQQLMREVSALEAPRGGPPAAATAEDGAASAAPPFQVLEVVKEFAKALSASFDLQRVLTLFLDAVAEMVHPSRCALLLADPDGTAYRVHAHRGLAPHLVDSVRLRADDGLPLWLHREGRVIYARETQVGSREPLTREVGRELATLQAVVAVPLMAHGDLAGILALGQRITGIPYSHRETEILFHLAAHLALAIQDIALHHRLRCQKAYIERILSHMSNGVITIDGDEKVTIVNHRAEAILKLPASEVLTRDLRVLPSPLGDLLYETLSRGQTVHRTEVQLARGKLPLEVSTYPIIGEGRETLGAVMVFDDLTTQRKLLAEKRQAEQLQLLARVVARIADEIKNPLVSINTFMELLEERSQDVEFRRHFSTVVGRDVKRLAQIFEKLAALVDEGGFAAELVDIRSVVEECLAELGPEARQEGGDGVRRFSLADEPPERELTVALSHQDSPLQVKGNHTQLKKAFGYLISYLIRKTPGNAPGLSLAIGRGTDNAGEDMIRVVISSRSAVVGEAELQRIFDPLTVVQENLIDLGPCVSQRIIEALGGRLEAVHGKREASFVASLPIT